MMANLLDRKWRAAERFLAQRASRAMCMALAPIRAQTTRKPHGRPPLDPVEEYGGRTKCFQGAPRREQFLEIGVGAF